MRHLDLACGQPFPIGSSLPIVIGYNAAAPGVYYVFDHLGCGVEYNFTDALQIDFASPSPLLDTDGVTRIGKCCRALGPCGDRTSVQCTGEILLWPTHDA